MSRQVDLPSDSKIEKLEGTAGTTMDEGVDAKDLTACCALCCVSTNLYCTWPGCIGCHQKGDLCCIQIEGVACKVRPLPSGDVGDACGVVNPIPYRYRNPNPNPNPIQTCCRSA
jgi:hypothetical protein